MEELAKLAELLGVSLGDIEPIDISVFAATTSGKNFEGTDRDT